MDNYPWDVGRSEHERGFLLRLEQLCKGHALFDAWTHHPQLVVTLSIDDPEQNVIVRTLRIDFDGRSLIGGNDPSHQIDPELDPEDPDYFKLRDALTASEYAERSFEWFRHQAARSIDRLEWDGTDHGWLLWVLAENGGRPLVAQYRDRPGRSPDRVVRLRQPDVS